LEIYFIARIHNLFREEKREQIALLKLNIRFQVIEWYLCCFRRERERERERECYKKTWKGRIKSFWESFFRLKNWESIKRIDSCFTLIATFVEKQLFQIIQMENIDLFIKEFVLSDSWIISRLVFTINGSFCFIFMFCWKS
jgi:hypothetical protein